MVDRVSSGITGFDELVEGGIPKGNIVLVSGVPGTGKSIFCAQVLFNNALKGKKCLYLNLEQNHNKLARQMKQFSMDLEKVKQNMKVVRIDSSDVSVVEAVLKEIKKVRYDLICLDSVDSISSMPLPPEELMRMGLYKIAESVIPTLLDEGSVGRMKLKKIFDALSESEATAFLTSERVEGAQGLSRDTISEFLCDGIVVLHAVEGEESFRSLHVPKMRLTRQKRGIYSFEIEAKGITIKTEEG